MRVVAVDLAADRAGKIALDEGLQFAVVGQRVRLELDARCAGREVKPAAALLSRGSQRGQCRNREGVAEQLVEVPGSLNEPG